MTTLVYSSVCNFFLFSILRYILQCVRQKVEMLNEFKFRNNVLLFILFIDKQLLVIFFQFN